MATRAWASFTLKPWANRGVPVPAMYEWFSLSFIPDAYLTQTSPLYKPATVRLTASIYQEVAVRAANAFIQLESSSLPLSSTPTLEFDSKAIPICFIDSRV